MRGLSAGARLLLAVALLRLATLSVACFPLVPALLPRWDALDLADALALSGLFSFRQRLHTHASWCSILLAVFLTGAGLAVAALVVVFLGCATTFFAGAGAAFLVREAPAESDRTSNGYR